MNKILTLSLMILLFSGCCGLKQEKAAIKIDGIEITAREFDKAFSLSQFAWKGPDGRKEFLDTFIQRKLILKEAEKLGLDKDPRFLDDIQLFWEQSLLKLILSKKMNRLSNDIIIDEAEIKDYYRQNKEKSFAGKQPEQVYDQIKLLLFKAKQAKAIGDWVDSLRKQAKTDIDYQSLGINN